MRDSSRDQGEVDLLEVGKRIEAQDEFQSRSPVPSVRDVTAWPFSWKFHQVNMAAKSINVF